MYSNIDEEFNGTVIWDEKTKRIYHELSSKGEKVGGGKPENYRIANIIYQDVEGKFFLYKVNDSPLGIEKKFEDLTNQIGLQMPRTPDYLMQFEGIKGRKFIGLRDDENSIQEFLEGEV